MTDEPEARAVEKYIRRLSHRELFLVAASGLFFSSFTMAIVIIIIMTIGMFLR